MIYFTADTHFGHMAILKHQKQRYYKFKAIDVMDDALIDNINATVGRDDTLYHLGDFCWQASRAGHYRQRINCKDIRVTRGNHDSSSLKQHVSQFEHMLFIKSPKIHLAHYPLISWGSLHYGAIHFYGHCHGSMEGRLDKFNPRRKAMDVGVDNIFNLIKAYRPISLSEILMLVG